MNILCISDTHCQHELLNQYLYDPDYMKDIDCIIHAGDATTSRDRNTNAKELRSFLDWYCEIPVNHKIFVPGNHDVSMEAKVIDRKEYSDITFLVHESTIIDGIVIFGSPYTPTFGTGWAYNVARHKINRYWDEIPLTTDILITHGPPLGILDQTTSGVEFSNPDNGNKYVLSCGDKALLTKIFNLYLEYHIFGHIHDEKDIYNNGIRIIDNTKYINASIVDIRHNFVNKPIKITI